MTELRPCPFCGSEDITVLIIAGTLAPEYCAICRECRARTAHASSPEKSAAMWNHRVTGGTFPHGPARA